jgi:pyridoxamine 5'-phosphate oxidase
MAQQRLTAILPFKKAAAMNTDFTPLADPWALFAQWFELAQHSEPSYPNAMLLATVGGEGMPSVRAVLMKDFDADGVVFYSNRESRKGQQLATHPKAGLCFYWKSLQRQVHFEGAVTLVSDAESDAYFATRPRGSQIGAWASLQSQTLVDRVTLELRVKEFERQYEGLDVPRPSRWGGYRLTPVAIEFWQEREFRLHDRIAYSRAPDADRWKIERRYP